MKTYKYNMNYNIKSKFNDKVKNQNIFWERINKLYDSIF